MCLNQRRHRVGVSPGMIQELAKRERRCGKLILRRLCHKFRKVLNGFIATTRLGQYGGP